MASTALESPHYSSALPESPGLQPEGVGSNLGEDWNGLEQYGHPATDTDCTDHGAHFHVDECGFEGDQQRVLWEVPHGIGHSLGVRSIQWR